MNPDTPKWAIAAAAAIVALVGAGYVLVRFFSFVGDKYLEWNTKRRTHQRTADAEDRRVAGEPWADVVERLTAELRDHEERLQKAEGRAAEALNGLATCRANEEGTKRLLRFVFAWGKSRGMKMSEETEREIREALGDSNAGSGTHRAQPLEGDDRD